MANLALSLIWLSRLHVSIFAKLLELGHSEVDFPRWHVEVNKSVALSDEGTESPNIRAKGFVSNGLSRITEWERIRPTVERAAESNKNGRIWRQSQRRRNERSRHLTAVWNGAVVVASGTRALNFAERGACPNMNEFFSFENVLALMSADTDGISPADQDSVRPEAIRIAIQGRRRYLVKLDNVLKGLPVDQTDEEEWSSLSDDEAISKLDTIAAELAQAVNGFWDSNRRTVDWYPSSYLRGPCLDLGYLSPAKGVAPGLIPKMLGSIDKDLNTEAGAVTNWTLGQRPVHFRCARCDERVAPYLSFSEMVSVRWVQMVHGASAYDLCL